MPWTRCITFVLLLATCLWGMVVHFHSPDSPPESSVDKFQAPHPDFSVKAVAMPRLDYSLFTDVSSSSSGQTSHQLSLAELLELAKTDPAAAAALALQLTNPTAREEAAVKIALAWGEANPAAAFTWAQGLTNAVTLRQNLLCSLCEQQAETDPAAALTSALALDLGNQKNNLVENLMMKWTTQDAAAALNWALQTPDEIERDRLVGRVAASLAEQTPEAAAQLVASKISAGEVQDQAALAVIYKWTQRDPAAAAAWVGNFPESSLQTEAVQNLIGSWALTDDAAAARWVAGLPAGPSHAAGALALEQTRQRLAPVAYVNQQNNQP